MKTLAFIILITFLFSSCSVERHDPNVRFTEKRTNYKELRNTGCGVNKRFILN